MSSQHNAVSQFLAVFSPIHRDGYKFVALAALVTVLLFLVSNILGIIGAFLTACIAFFFRDPERVTPLRDGLVVAPADGTIVRVDNVTPPPELGLGSAPLTCVSIFLSLLDVHVTRAPVGGQIQASAHRDGVFRNAASPEAQSENERHGFVIGTASGAKFGLVLVAGYAARRIVPFVKLGDGISAGERIGLIRFGSRVDIYLPSGQGLLVAEGQRTIAGETVIADQNSNEPSPLFRRG
jgi:phosphatidylserine decarboxylase